MAVGERFMAGAAPGRLHVPCILCNCRDKLGPAENDMVASTRAGPTHGSMVQRRLTWPSIHPLCLPLRPAGVWLTRKTCVQSSS